MEARRRQAVRMFNGGSTQAEVARALGVSRQSASRWFKKWRVEGAKAVKGAGRAGRRSRLSDRELRQVDRVLRKGPEAHGYPTDLWTLDRVAEVIERVTGVRYHPGHVWRILKGIGWSLQRPARRAVERDEEKVRGWVRDRWPRVKKTHGGEGLG
jgi:transposase